MTSNLNANCYTKFSLFRKNISPLKFLLALIVLHLTSLRQLCLVERLFDCFYKLSFQDVHNLDYIGPAVAAEQLTGKLEEFGFKKDISVLDLGCGSGLVGEQLHKRGYQNIDGLDLSEEFLEEAQKKGVYRYSF